MLRTILVLVVAMFTLAAADKAPGKDTGPKYHLSLLGDAPWMFDQTGNRVVPKHIIKQKYLFLYFSASWCGPCHKFNPDFIAWYKANGGGKDFEVILVGSDNDTASVKAYMKDQGMPWLAFEMEGKRFAEIKAKYGGKGIPVVALLDENDQVVAHSYDGDKYLGPRVALEKYLQLTKGK